MRASVPMYRGPRMIWNIICELTSHVSVSRSLHLSRARYNDIFLYLFFVKSNFIYVLTKISLFFYIL